MILSHKHHAVFGQWKRMVLFNHALPWGLCAFFIWPFPQSVDAKIGLSAFLFGISMGGILFITTIYYVASINHEAIKISSKEVYFFVSIAIISAILLFIYFISMDQRIIIDIRNNKMQFTVAGVLTGIFPGALSALLGCLLLPTSPPANNRGPCRFYRFIRSMLARGLGWLSAVWFLGALQWN